MMGLHSPSWSSGKLPLWGGIGLAVFCPPPGPPKLIAPSQTFSARWMFRLSGYLGAFCCKRLLLIGNGNFDFLGGIKIKNYLDPHTRVQPYNLKVSLLYLTLDERMFSAASHPTSRDNCTEGSTTIATVIPLMPVFTCMLLCNDILSMVWY